MSGRPGSLDGLPTLTPAQRDALMILAGGERTDESVRVVTTDQARQPRSGLTVRWQQAKALVDLGLARQSTPGRHFLLITPLGRELVAWLNVTAEARP